VSQIKRIANRLRIISNLFLGQESKRFYPREVVIELTNHCNLACVMCPYTEMHREKGFMAPEVFRSIIEQIRDHSELVYLYGIGESLLHKRLNEYIDIASNAGLTTLVSTNGLALTESNARALLSTSLDYLIVSLDGGTKETYESIRIKGDFDRLVSNIKMLLRLRREMGAKTRIQIQMIVMEANAHEKHLFRGLFTADEVRQIDMFRFKPVFSTFAGPGESVQHTKPCHSLWSMMSIAWDGRLQLCCMDYEASWLEGDLKVTPLIDLWNSVRLQDIRARHRRLDYSGLPCDGCNYPEQGYYSAPAVLASTLVSAKTIHKLLPMYERLVVLARRWRK
jgi:sulfatase maturation enzyme AslB (radical SAM superfamily)